MNAHFYRLESREMAAARPLGDDLRIHCWQPERDGLPGRGSRRPINFFWWALAKAGGFARPGFAEIRVERARRVVHRLVVTPRWYRFPFMGADDLQVGDVWTAPDARRRQLAKIAIAEAHRRFAGDGTTIWYLAIADNEASAALARSCGYRHVATGRRTRRFGTAIFGQYVIDRLV